MSKKCKGCGVIKPLTEYYVKSERKDGHQSRCKECTGGMYRRNATLKHRYGITVDEYDRMLEYQAGGCAICGTAVSQDGRALAVDHDHTTGAVRGLLCANCNKGLGLFNDDINLLDNAINYIRKPNG